MCRSANTRILSSVLDFYLKLIYKFIFIYIKAKQKKFNTNEIEFLLLFNHFQLIKIFTIDGGFQ